MAIWTGLFFWIEDAWDDVRGKRDAGNTVLASATVAGGFSLWSKSHILLPTNSASLLGSINEPRTVLSMSKHHHIPPQKLRLEVGKMRPT